jgi:hypothetical protein
VGCEGDFGLILLLRRCFACLVGRYGAFLVGASHCIALDPSGV